MSVAEAAIVEATTARAATNARNRKSPIIDPPGFSRVVPPAYVAFSNVIISVRVTVTHLVVTGGPPPPMCHAA